MNIFCLQTRNLVTLGAMIHVGKVPNMIDFGGLKISTLICHSPMVSSNLGEFCVDFYDFLANLSSDLLHTF